MTPRNLILFCFLFYSLTGIGQPDTINQKDEDGRRTGYWIICGKDRPEKNYPPEGKIEEGNFYKDRKEGVWAKYYNDGVTIKLKGTYRNGRPNGEYEKYYPNGQLKEKGCFQMRKEFNDTCNEMWRFYETGVLMSYQVKLKDGDSSVYYFANGCLERSSRSKGQSAFILEYSIDSCNLVIDTITYPRNYETSKTPSLKIVRPINKDMIPLDPYIDSVSVRPEYTTGTYNDSCLCLNTSNGKIKSYDENQDLIFSGNCQEGKVWDGKIYYYDSDGILFRVEDWKKGEFLKVGRL